MRALLAARMMVSQPRSFLASLVAYCKSCVWVVGTFLSANEVEVLYLHIQFDIGTSSGVLAWWSRPSFALLYKRLILMIFLSTYHVRGSSEWGSSDFLFVE
jgi:hypothetical protein